MKKIKLVLATEEKKSTEKVITLPMVWKLNSIEHSSADKAPSWRDAIKTFWTFDTSNFGQAFKENMYRYWDDNADLEDLILEFNPSIPDPEKVTTLGARFKNAFVKWGIK